MYSKAISAARECDGRIITMLCLDVTPTIWYDAVITALALRVTNLHFTTARSQHSPG